MKNILKNIIDKIKNYFKTFTFKKFLKVLLLVVEIVILIIIISLNKLIGNWCYLIWGLLLLGVILVLFQNKKLLRYVKGNGVIFGNRGSGKGLLLNYLIVNDKTKPYCNVPYGNRTEDINVGEYFNVLNPNTLNNFIDNNIKIINKTPFEKYEGRNIYLDDVNIYFPNWADNKLKKEYPSMPVLLAISRHLFNNNMVITTQTAERPYKMLRELQTDYGIQVKYSIWFSEWIPFLRYFCFTNYIYYENIESKGLLPFESLNMLGELTKGIRLNAGTSIKKEYEARNGVIRRGRLLQRKSKVCYDTRYFHTKVFGKKP